MTYRRGPVRQRAAIPPAPDATGVCADEFVPTPEEASVQKTIGSCLNWPLPLRAAWASPFEGKFDAPIRHVRMLHSGSALMSLTVRMRNGASDRFGALHPLCRSAAMYIRRRRTLPTKPPQPNYRLGRLDRRSFLKSAGHVGVAAMALPSG